MNSIPRTPLIWISISLLAAHTAQAQVPAQGGFVDPAPPKVNVLEPMASPAARTYDELTTHRAPGALPEGARSADWPSFLGPDRNGYCEETGLAIEWGPGGPPLLWEMRRGQGFASPVVAEGRLVYVHRVGAELAIDCLDPATGKRFWRHALPCDYRPRYISDAGQRSTPVIHGGRVYVHSVEGTLLCLELATGRVVWQRSLHKDLGTTDDFFGVVSSPLIVGDLLIQNTGAPDGPCVAAFELSTGKLVWGAGREWGASCASPVAGEVHGRERVFVMAGGDSRPPTGGLLVLDPKDGKVDFTYPFRSRTYESVNGACPVLGDDWVFLTASYNTGSATLALDAKGGFEELWKSRRIGIQFSNPIRVGEYVYLIDGTSDRAGALVCLEAATGKEVSRTDFDWEDTVVSRGEEKVLSFSIGEGSLLYFGGRFLILGDQGHILWVDASPKGAKVLARASLFRAHQSWTPPVVSHGLLYVCQNTRERFGAEPNGLRLLCFDLRARK